MLYSQTRNISYEYSNIQRCYISVFFCCCATRDFNYEFYHNLFELNDVSHFRAVSYLIKHKLTNRSVKKKMKYKWIRMCEGKKGSSCK